MYGKTASQMHREDRSDRGYVALSLAIAALLVAVAALFLPNGSIFSGLLPVNCSNGLTVNSGVNVYPKNGIDGIGAYQVWLSQGNTGSQDDFLKSLIGTKGADGYVGKNGKSAYQLWLDAGNKGSQEDFLSSLEGVSGTKGADGLSAYELWLSTGNAGTLQQFLNSLVGATGATGSSGLNGSNGQSAYEIWRDNGHASGTVADFLNSLVGAAGASGAPGAVGPAGPVGPAGADGVCNIGVGGYYGSFWDEVTQTSTQSVNGMILRRAGSASGVSVVDASGNPSTDATPGSLIKFSHAGTYNIAFSAQVVKTQGGSLETMSIWLRQNGLNVPFSNTNLDFANNGVKQVAAWNFFVDVAAGDTVEIAWHVTSGNLVIYGQPATSNGVDIPGIPSVILTVNQVR